MTGRRHSSSSDSDDFDHDKVGFGNNYIAKYGPGSTTSEVKGLSARRRNDQRTSHVNTIPTPEKLPLPTNRRRLSVLTPQSDQARAQPNRSSPVVSLESDIQRHTSKAAPTSQVRLPTQQHPQTPTQAPTELGDRDTASKHSEGKKQLSSFNIKLVLTGILTTILAGVLCRWQLQLWSADSQTQFRTVYRHVSPPVELTRALKSPHMQSIHDGIRFTVEGLRGAKLESLDAAVEALTDLARNIRGDQNTDDTISTALGVDAISQLRRATDVRVDRKEEYERLLHTLTLVQLDNDRAWKSTNHTYTALRGWFKVLSQGARAAEEMLERRTMQAKAMLYDYISPEESAQNLAEHTKIKAQHRLLDQATLRMTELVEDAHRELGRRTVIAERLHNVAQLVARRVGSPNSAPLRTINMQKNGVDLDVRDLIRKEYRAIFEVGSNSAAMGLVDRYIPVG